MEPPSAPPQHHHRLMCSYGGHIVTRPRDKSLCYVGGETRIIIVNRQTTLSALIQSLSKNLKRTQSFVIKYQLPNEDLDSLISIATDEDLENMFEEYDRLTSRKSSGRLRLFLFPAKLDSVSALGSMKSGDLFLNALNDVDGRRFSESSSVNSLLSLYDDNPIGHSKEVRNDTVAMTSSSLEMQLAQISIVPSVAPAPVISDYQNQSDPLLSLLQQKQNCSFDFPSPGSVSSDGSNSNALSQIQTSRSSTEYGYSSQQLHHQQQQFIPQYIQNPHPVTPYYQIYPQHIHPVYYVPAEQTSPALKPETGSVTYRSTSIGAPGQTQVNMRGNNVIYGQEFGEQVQAHLYYHGAQPKQQPQGSRTTSQP